MDMTNSETDRHEKIEHNITYYQCLFLANKFHSVIWDKKQSVIKAKDCIKAEAISFSHLRWERSLSAMI